MKLIAIMNVKGGVGKTLTACNMAHILADVYKQRVILIDADPQGNATAFFNRSAQDGGLTELLTGLATCYDEVVQDTEYKHLQLIGCDSSLFDVDLRPDHGCVDPRKVLVDLKDALTEDDACDIVLVDCPPSFTASAISALAAADSVIVPVKMDAFSVCKINGNADLAGVLVTLWHNTPCNVQGEAELRRRGIKVFETHIRRSDKADESTWFHSPICEYSKYSSTAKDYRDFVAEFVKNGGLKDGRI